ncbi:unnamed protein product [Orchesella dallaii]|uniref:Uncharacterized protein n=1 Tax=Orchesella dallaii TaxID=48710 RepID=A0ABP1S7Z6_9HEXA
MILLIFRRVSLEVFHNFIRSDPCPALVIDANDPRFEKFAQPLDNKKPLLYTMLPARTRTGGAKLILANTNSPKISERTQTSKKQPAHDQQKLMPTTLEKFRLQQRTSKQATGNERNTKSQAATVFKDDRQSPEKEQEKFKKRTRPAVLNKSF